MAFKRKLKLWIQADSIKLTPKIQLTQIKYLLLFCIYTYRTYANKFYKNKNINLHADNLYGSLQSWNIAQLELLNGLLVTLSDLSGGKDQ